jgi:hypothetical protein
VKYYYSILLLFGNYLTVYAQKGYKTRFDKAVSVEMWGIGSGTSLNVEYVPQKSDNGFLLLRLGAGFIPAKSQGVSFPSSITYNLWLRKSLNNECNPYPRKTYGEWFLEAGVGQTYTAYTDELNNNKKYYLSPILGIRKHIARTGSSSIIFYKIQLTPRKISEEWEFYGGFSAGISF